MFFERPPFACLKNPSLAERNQQRKICKVETHHIKTIDQSEGRDGVLEEPNNLSPHSYASSKEMHSPEAGNNRTLIENHIIQISMAPCKIMNETRNSISLSAAALHMEPLLFVMLFSGRSCHPSLLHRDPHMIHKSCYYRIRHRNYHTGLLLGESEHQLCGHQDLLDHCHTEKSGPFVAVGDLGTHQSLAGVIVVVVDRSARLVPLCWWLIRDVQVVQWSLGLVQHQICHR